ncbi:MAG: DUF4870 domain-containing protein [Myxococcota bacterium]
MADEPADQRPSERPSEEKLMLVLSYLGPLALVPYLADPDAEEVRWHAKQGLTFTGAWIAVSVSIAILGAVPGIGLIVGILAPFLWLAGVAIVVVAIINALRGERWRIPVVADLADQW